MELLKTGRIWIITGNTSKLSMEWINFIEKFIHSENLELKDYWIEDNLFFYLLYDEWKNKNNIFNKDRIQK